MRRKNIKIETLKNQLKTQIDRFDRELERFKDRPLTDNTQELICWLQTARDNASQKVFSLENQKVVQG